MSLQVWLPLNGDLHNQGLSDSIMSGSNVSTNTSGKIGSCYSFNGSNSYLKSNITCLSNDSDEWSYTCWFYPNNAHNGCLFSNRTTANSTGITIFYYTSQFLIDDGVRWQFTPSTSIQVGAWNHLAIVRKAGAYKKLYLNGKLVNSTATTGTPSKANASWFSIGTSQDSGTAATGNPLNGKLNDVRIYDHALSVKEVEEIAKGLVLHYPLDNGGGQSNLILYSHFQNAPWKSAIRSWQEYEGKYSMLVNPATIYNNTSKGTTPYFPGQTFKENTQYTLSLDTRDDYRTDGKTTGFRIGFHYTDGTGSNTNLGSPKTWKHYTIVSAAGKTVDFIRGSYGNGGYTYVANLKLEEGTVETGFGLLDSDIIYDCSGYNNNGIVVGDIDIDTNTSKYTCCMKQKSGQYIRVEKRPVVCMPRDAITINLWQYATSWSNPISCTESGGWNFENSSGIRFPVYISGVGYKVAQSSITPASTLNAWHMLTGTMDKDNIKIYYDGEEVGSVATGSTNGIGYANNYIFIGGEATGNNTTPANSSYTGSISDVRIYATALTPEQILELYNTSATIDNKGNVYSREYVENDELNVTKTGLFQCNKIYDDDELTVASIVKSTQQVQGNTIYEY